MRYFVSLFMALCLSVGVFAQEATDTITIFMIGDSTMANKPLEKENQERGWGQMLPLMLQGPIRVDNHAKNGRSSLSFINEGLWDAVVSKIKPGDYVIIQFGHNDEKPKADRHTDPGSTFDENLRKFIRDTRAKGGYPVLCNSIVRRNFPAADTVKHVDRDDKPLKGYRALSQKPEGELLVDTHHEYVNAPRNVAREMAVPFLEMNTLTHNLVQGLGRENSKALFMWIPDGKYEFCPEGKVDNTHLTIYGGTVVAGIGARALAEAVPALRPYIKAEYNYTY